MLRNPLRDLQVSPLKTPTSYRRSFDPRVIFASGERGLWYDPSDLSTLFQDSFGTTPVTAPGQPVGLMLDKSKNLQLGPELVTNGNFTGGSTGWVTPTGWSISGAVAVGSAVSASLINTTFVPVAGRFYRVEFDVISYTSGTLYITVGANFAEQVFLGSSQMTPGRKSLFIRSGATGSRGVEFYGGSVTANIDNVSVKEVFGAHALQATPDSRPTYGVVPATGRRNLFTYSEQFDNAVWIPANGASVLPNVTTAPDGSNSADALVSGTAASGYVASVINLGTSSYTFSVYLKAGTTSTLSLGFYTNAFVAATGSILSGPGAITGGDLMYVSGLSTTQWTRLRITVTGTGGQTFFLLYPETPATGTNKSVYVWGAQLEVGSVATAYQRVVSNFDVTEAGVPTLSYLQFDGYDELTAQGVNLMGSPRVSAIVGTRKEADNIYGTLLSHGTAVHVAGYWQIFAPLGGTNYDWRAFNSAAGGIDFAVAGFPQPDLAVISGIFDPLAVTGSQIMSRRNGAIIGMGGANLAPFTETSFTIGRRGPHPSGDTPFVGRVYGVIVSGDNVGASTIGSLETWMNQRVFGL